MCNKILLIGGGGHAKSVIDSLQQTNEFEIVGILDCANKIGKRVHGIPIIDTDGNLERYYELGVKNAFITIGSVGNSINREKIAQKIQAIGYKLPNIIDKTAILSKDLRLGIGNFIAKGVIINTEVIIENNCIINTGSIIEHECIIKEFAHIAPGSTLCGGVKIGAYTHVGASSTIIQYVSVGKNTMIGAGSIVTKSIGDNIKAFGNPCKERGEV